MVIINEQTISRISSIKTFTDPCTEIPELPSLDFGQEPQTNLCTPDSHFHLFEFCFYHFCSRAVNLMERSGIFCISTCLACHLLARVVDFVERCMNQPILLF